MVIYQLNVINRVLYFAPNYWFWIIMALCKSCGKKSYMGHLLQERNDLQKNLWSIFGRKHFDEYGVENVWFWKVLILQPGCCQLLLLLLVLPLLPLLLISHTVSHQASCEWTYHHDHDHHIMIITITSWSSRSSPSSHLEPGRWWSSERTLGLM